MSSVLYEQFYFLNKIWFYWTLKKGESFKRILWLWHFSPTQLITSTIWTWMLIIIPVDHLIWLQMPIFTFYFPLACTFHLINRHLSMQVRHTSLCAMMKIQILLETFNYVLLRLRVQFCTNSLLDLYHQWEMSHMTRSFPPNTALIKPQSINQWN